MTAEIKNLLEKAHISLLLDSYDALFSDFDPRPYVERTISDDFLVEVKRAVREAQPGVLEMRFLIPKHMKNTHEEEIIKERLHGYFHKQAMQVSREARHIVRNAIGLVGLGFVLMIAATWIHQQLMPTAFFDFLRVMMEPAGWFLVWYGFDQIFYDAKSRKPDFEFNHKMAKAEIHFDTY